MRHGDVLDEELQCADGQHRIRQPADFAPSNLSTDDRQNTPLVASTLVFIVARADSAGGVPAITGPSQISTAPPIATSARAFNTVCAAMFSHLGVADGRVMP